MKWYSGCPGKTHRCQKVGHNPYKNSGVCHTCENFKPVGCLCRKEFNLAQRGLVFALSYWAVISRLLVVMAYKSIYILTEGLGPAIYNSSNVIWGEEFGSCCISVTSWGAGDWEQPQGQSTMCMWQSPNKDFEHQSSWVSFPNWQYSIYIIYQS